jgi:enoyl-CoA hydratase/carnithine racemase
MSDLVRVTRSDGVLTLTLDRPEKKNALTDAMYRVLADQLEAGDADSEVRVVLIRSEGDLFTAGNDLSEFAQAAVNDAELTNVGRFIGALASARKPIIAAVQGRAVGIGTTLLLHCDYVILAEDAWLSTPFVGLGLVPEAASTLLMPARIGHARAFMMFALGDPVSAATALEWGLANQVVAQAELDGAAAAVAGRLAGQPLGALIATKGLMRDAAGIQEQVRIEGEAFAARLNSPEAQEAFLAFAQRRAPDFRQFA